MKYSCFSLESIWKTILNMLHRFPRQDCPKGQALGLWNPVRVRSIYPLLYVQELFRRGVSRPLREKPWEGRRNQRRGSPPPNARARRPTMLELEERLQGRRTREGNAKRRPCQILKSGAAVLFFKRQLNTRKSVKGWIKTEKS